MIVPHRSYLDAIIKEDEVVFSIERGLRDRCVLLPTSLAVVPWAVSLK